MYKKHRVQTVQPYLFFFFAFLKVFARESIVCKLFGGTAEKELINLNKFNRSDINTTIGKGKRNVAVLCQVFMTWKKSAARVKKTLCNQSNVFWGIWRRILEIFCKKWYWQRILSQLHYLHNSNWPFSIWKRWTYQDRKHC